MCGAWGSIGCFARSCITLCISVRRKTRSCSTWQNRFPVLLRDSISELAAANDIVLVTSLFEKRAPGLYHNTAVVFERDGSIAGKYRKMHIPDDPAYYEKFYFTPGDIGFEPIQTSLGKLGGLRVLGPMVSGSSTSDGAEGS